MPKEDHNCNKQNDLFSQVGWLFGLTLLKEATHKHKLQNKLSRGCFLFSTELVRVSSEKPI